VRSGRITHDFLFFQGDGAPLNDLSYPYRRWRYVMNAAGVRYRAPYNARHSFISWSIMIGKNLLKLACEDGHSLQTMVSTYAGWTERATDADVASIRQAMSEPPGPENIDGAHRKPGQCDIDCRPKSRPRGRLSWRAYKSHAERNSSRPMPRLNPPRISWRSPKPLAVEAAKAAATR
jgi:hypothetical protein